MRLKKLIMFVAAAALILVAVQAQAASTKSVSIKNFAFDPKEITIAAGDTVTWTNMDAARHDVDLDDNGHSPSLSKGETYSKTFDKPGTYDYDCDIHPNMKGRVIVK